MIFPWLGAAFFLAAAAVAFRWVMRRHDSMGRLRSFPWISCMALVILGVAVLVPWVLRVRLEDRLARASSRLLGVEVDVHCQSFGEAFVDAGAEFGFVPFGADGVPERNTLIKRNQCRDLADYLRSDKQSPSLKQVVAVHTLTHEAMHMSGITDEAATECSAVQRNAEMAVLLGADAASASRLARTYWEEIYPRMPSDYSSSGCVPGGALDIGAPSPPWAWMRGSPGDPYPA